MWIARLTATFPHTHSPAKCQTFLNLEFNVKTDRSDSNLDWNLLVRPCPMLRVRDLSGFVARQLSGRHSVPKEVRDEADGTATGDPEDEIRRGI